ncbi:hypothetical protein EXIGLDRAFT_832641 [Exidia glandulosa HHB12029]|uniref:Uncharacterized protein n=1 Tax=Exidia glandulosa HHB12029 TaxID=1314781 RepID=A0A165LE56_EXIGL|nr:hypothetical protein EXIGLDRAFT_832641 [Exidia glandulosa HHB12029]
MQYAVVVLSLGALVAAQDFKSLSQACQNGVTAVQSNAEANSCINVSGLLSLLVVPADQSLITPVNNWLTAFCGADDCSSETIQAVVANVSTACATDFESLGVTQDQINTVLPYIQDNFGAAKQIICLADTTQDEFCVTELANNLQTFLGAPLTLNTLKSNANLQSAEGVPTNITCVPCTQAALVKLKDTQLSTVVDLSSAVGTECGADFSSATTSPSNIIVGTGSNVPKGQNGDGSASPLAVAGSLSALAGILAAAFLA